MEREIFTGTFTFSEYNSRDVYDRVHTLTLKYEEGKFKGTLRQYNCYGTEIFSDSILEVDGYYNGKKEYLEITIHVPRNKLLLFKYTDHTYYGNFVSYGDRWDKWEKKESV
jgi:hypothetical protein